MLWLLASFSIPTPPSPLELLIHFLPLFAALRVAENVRGQLQERWRFVLLAIFTLHVLGT